MNRHKRRAAAATGRALKGGKQLSIARALSSLSPSDEATLCAFVETCELDRQTGRSLQGWRVTRDAKGWMLECMSIDGDHLTATGDTCEAACKSLSQQIIADAMKGAPTA